MVRIGPWRPTCIQQASNKHLDGPTTAPNGDGGMGGRLARMALLMGKDIAYDVEDGSGWDFPRWTRFLVLQSRIAPTLVAQG